MVMAVNLNPPQQLLSFSSSLITRLNFFRTYYPPSLSSSSTKTLFFNSTKLTSIQSSSLNPPPLVQQKTTFSNKTTASSSSSLRDTKSSTSSSRFIQRENKNNKNKKDNENAMDNKKKQQQQQQQQHNNNRNRNKDKDTPQVKLRVTFDTCSKRGDLMGALSLYDSAISQGIQLGQHHYTVLLYLCSSAAIGVLKPAKSGTGIRTLNAAISSSFEDRNDNNKLLDNNNSVSYSDDDDDSVKLVDNIDNNKGKSKGEIFVTDDIKKHALQRGFEVYHNMCLDKVEMNEAALTSVARMAMAMGDGDMAFEMVKQMKVLGLNPRLRSYGPALSTYCSSGEVDKAFEVESHMLEHGVCPEEPELEALLRVSIRGGKSDRVYYVLHKLRSAVRKVSSSTADLIVDWFMSNQASRVGKRKWDKRFIIEAMENNGGGWHGKGWLGKGKWQVLYTTVGNDGMCKCCGVQLATIDLDPVETENFAKSVASIAISKEKHSNFENFQKWLDYYGPFEAVIDAANVGLFGQRKFMPSKVNAVVNGIRQKLPSKTFPLVVLHNRRIKGDRKDEGINRILVDKWNNVNALYATPTGSNDDWYWLYAAIKFKCLLVTNDEMRDHLFQLLGNDFFPKWKERHQVRFSFADSGPEFHMPPPCSVVIQESEEGHWHIPIEAELHNESERRWLCISRANLDMVGKDSTTSKEDKPMQNGEHAKSATRNKSAKEFQLTTSESLQPQRNERKTSRIVQKSDIMSN